MGASLDQVGQLAAPTPPDIIRTRPAPGGGGKVLSYVTARDVMDRFDESVGPENWQVRFHEHMGRTLCDIGVKIADEWVWKSDGAGDTSIEGEKGGQSDAFKRAAVMWGFARDLYPKATASTPAPPKPAPAKAKPGVDWAQLEQYIRGLLIAADTGRGEDEWRMVLVDACRELEWLTATGDPVDGATYKGAIADQIAKDAANRQRLADEVKNHLAPWDNAPGFVEGVGDA